MCGMPKCMVPYGTCHCGCERVTGLYKSTNVVTGGVKGFPKVYCEGHQRAKPRTYLASENPRFKYIPLTQNMHAKVNSFKFSTLDRWTWTLRRGEHGDCYAMRQEHRNGKLVTILMHNFLKPPSKGKIIDHRDRDGLNNTLGNLREATPRQNKINQKVPKNNTSGYAGITHRKENDKWRVRISPEAGKRITVGNCASLAEAVKLREAAEREHYGKFSPRLKSRK